MFFNSLIILCMKICSPRDATKISILAFCISAAVATNQVLDRIKVNPGKILLEIVQRLHPLGSLQKILVGKKFLIPNGLHSRIICLVTRCHQGGHLLGQTSLHHLGYSSINPLVQFLAFPLENNYTKIKLRTELGRKGKGTLGTTSSKIYFQGTKNSIMVVGMNSLCGNI